MIETTIVPQVKSPDELRQEMFNWLKETMGDTATEILPELAAIFIEDSAMLRNDIAQALSQQDLQSAGKAAHTLKGSSASMGFKRFSAIAKQIEVGAKSNNKAQIELYLPDLDVEHQRITQMLKDYL